jgi:hypothetical protein
VVAPAGGAPGDGHDLQAGPLQALHRGVGVRGQSAASGERVVDIAKNAAHGAALFNGKLA